MKKIKINGENIGNGFKPYIIAEMSGNHNGDIGRAIELVQAAKDAGASAVKLQTYTADTITIDHNGPEFRIENGIWKGRNLYELYQEAHTPWEWHKELFDVSRKIGITIFSSPFDHTAVDFLESLNTPAYKIASFELIDLPLIKKVASTKKPLIMSTGNASLSEIEEAVAIARDNGANQLALLHCTSGYPTPAREANISTIKNLADSFDCVTGLSDHTMDIGVSVAAVALGASIIEKHFTIARSDGGPDSSFSLEKDELKSLVINANMSFEAIGKPNYSSTSAELKTKCHRRSLFITQDIKKGDVYSANNIKSIRPGGGLLPKFYDDVIGNKATSDLQRGTPLAWKHIDMHG